MTGRATTAAIRGVVSVVGAGPGDPELLTVRAVRRLEAADVVFYDGLVPAAVVAVAASARHVEVSRRPGSDRIQPAAVAALMVAAAQAGERVVRLRAGDPFVLARGAEELLTLVDSDVPFEIVPGLTSASAAPTLAGIPLTHRGTASAFVVVSGHDEGTYGRLFDGLPANDLSVVVLMGIEHAASIGGRLLRAGWRGATPAAVVFDASRPEQKIWEGTLDDLAVSPPDRASGASGVIVIGDVVGLRSRLTRTLLTEATDNRRDRLRRLPESAGAGGRDYGRDQRSDDLRSSASVVCERS